MVHHRIRNHHRSGSWVKSLLVTQHRLEDSRGWAKSCPFGLRNFLEAWHPHAQRSSDHWWVVVFLPRGQKWRNYCPPYPTEIEHCVANERCPILRRRLNCPRKRTVDERHGGLVQVPDKRSKHIIGNANIKATSEERRFFALGE